MFDRKLGENGQVGDWSRRDVLKMGGLATGLSIVALSGCSVSTGGDKKSSSSSSGGKPSKHFPLDRWDPKVAPGDIPDFPKRIGFLNNLAGTSMNDGFSAAFNLAAAHHSLKVVQAAPAGDAAKGVTQVQDMLRRGVVGVLSTLPNPEMQGIADKAMADGVGVIQFNRGPSTSALYSVQYDGGYNLGVYTAKWVKENLGGKAEIAYLSMDYDPTLALRGKGFKAAMRDAGMEDQIVAYVTPPAKPGGTQSAGNALMTTILQQHPGVQVIAGAADDLALGAMSVMKAKGKTGSEFMACGIDGGDQALQYVESGSTIFRATVGVNFNYAAYCPARMIGRWSEGLTIPQVQIFNYFTIDSPEVASKFAKDTKVSELERVFDEMVNGDNSYVTPLGTINYETRGTFYDGDMVEKLPTLNFKP